MRTTIDLPDELFRQVKARAALDGTTLKELIARFVDQGLRRAQPLTSDSATRRRSALPVAREKTGRQLPIRSNADLQAILDAEDVDRDPVG